MSDYLCNSSEVLCWRGAHSQYKGNCLDNKYSESVLFSLFFKFIKIAYFCVVHFYFYVCVFSIEIKEGESEKYFVIFHVVIVNVFHNSQINPALVHVIIPIV